MTSAQVVEKGQISLDGFYYRLKGPVESYLTSLYAQRIVIGPPDQDAHQDVSYLRWDNWTQGIGLEEFFSAGGSAPLRAWFSECNLSNDKHLTLGPLAKKTAAITGTFPTPSTGDDVPVLVIFKDNLYCILRNTVAAVDRMRIYKYDDAGDSWGSAVATMPTPSEAETRNTDAVVGFVGTTLYIIVCAGIGYTFSSDGAAWTDSGKDAMRVAIHDGSLWGIDRTGQLWNATTLGTEINKAQLPVPTPAGATDVAYISDLFTAPDASGEPSLWAATAFGLFLYDQTNNEWIKTAITQPEAKYNGRGTNIWNADLYVPAGLGVNRVIFGSSTDVLLVGPDLDHGLPDIHRGAIVDMAPGHEIIVAALEGDFPGFRSFVTTATTLRTVVLAYDGLGWQVLWKSATASERVRKVLIGSAYSKYRLWFSTTVGTTARDIYFIDLPSERVNPNQAQNRDYAASSVHETPWYKVGEDVEGIALSWLMETRKLSATETVQLEYEVNYSGTYTDLGTVSADLTTEFLLPSATDPTGVPFHAIRARATLARGSTTTLTPDLLSLTLKFLKKISDRQSHIVTLDLSEEIGGQSPRDQWRNLRASIRARKLLEFTFRDDPNLNAEDRFFVRVLNFKAVMDSGFDYRGEVMLSLQEVQHVVGGMWDIDRWDQFLWA